ncbi:MAG: YqgE/AlgH family protein [Thermoleophilaceae bacterium]
MDSDSLRGQLLIAGPALIDPNFSRAVVLVTEHNDEGAMGLVLNRPSTSTVDEALPDLELDVAEPEDVVYVGGPVQPAAAMILAEFDEPGDAATIVLEDVGFVSVEPDLPGVSVATRRARVFAGYAGWGPGQLEAEIERDDWILEEAAVEDVLGDSSEELWSEVLWRKGGEYALLSRMPLDPSLN